MYLHEHSNWAEFTWDDSILLPLLSDVRFSQGRLLGKIADLGFSLTAEAELDALTDEIIASSKIEGVVLDTLKVRSSVSKQLGIEAPVPAIDTHDVDGVVDAMFDATRNHDAPLSRDRLYGWHAALFPLGYSGLRKINAGSYRVAGMQVVSGSIGKEKIHYEAPDADQVESLMGEFIARMNEDVTTEPLIKAGYAHLWFLTIHPFDDGNGRVARALTELLLARSDRTARRFYSMAEQILAEREVYYSELERAQKGGSDITQWLFWFLNTLLKSIERSEKKLQDVLDRSLFWQRLEGMPLNGRQRKMIARLKGDFEGKLTASKWAKMCKVSPDTALRDIKDLIDKKVLISDGAGGRSTAYCLVDVEAFS